MAEGHAFVECQQSVRLVNRRERDPEPFASALQQQRIADRVGRCDEQQAPRVLGDGLESSEVALLDPFREIEGPRHAEPTGQLRRCQPTWQLEQRERVASCLREDPVAYAHVQREPQCRAQQRAGIAVEQAVHLEIRQVPKLLARLPCREHESHRLGQQPASDERERQRRGLIQPLRVVDDAEQGTLLSDLRDQAQDAQADEKPVRGCARAEPEHDLHGLTLWSRQPLEPIEQRRAELVQTRVGQLHLGLHPHRADDGEIRRRVDQVLQQRRLPDPGLAPQNQRAALALPDRPDQPVQQGALASPALQARLPPRSGQAIFHRPEPMPKRAPRAPQARISAATRAQARRYEAARGDRCGKRCRASGTRGSGAPRRCEP